MSAPIAAHVRIGHGQLKVADLDRAFCVGMLGFEVTERMDDQAAFISAGGYHHIGLNPWASRDGSPTPPGTTGLYHVAILHPDCASLADALRRLVGAGIALDGAANHGVSEALYLHDPGVTPEGRCSPRRRAVPRASRGRVAPHGRRRHRDDDRPARSARGNAVAVSARCSPSFRSR